MAIGLINENTLTSIAESIREKLGYSSIQMYPQEMPEYINIITSNPAYKEINDVNFYDFDGTLLYSVDKDEMTGATSMPPLPGNKPNMQVEGWNWTLQEIQNELNTKAPSSGTNACINVGCTYHTIDNSVDFFTKIGHDNNKVQLVISASTANDVTINWGDGTSDVQATTTTGTLKKHTYQNPSGDAFYHITVKANTGNVMFTTNRTICSATSTGTSMTASSFNFQFGVLNIACPKPQYVGGGASRLRPFSAMALCFLPDLQAISFSSGFTLLPNRLLMCTISLRHFTYPKGITAVESSAFCFSTALETVSLPSGITTIAGAAFANCAKLRSVNIPKGVKSIGDYAFYRCYSLESLVLPDTLSTLSGANLATDCKKLKNVYLASYTPPHISSTAVFGTYIEKIHIPYGTLNAYRNGWFSGFSASILVDDYYC